MNDVVHGLLNEAFRSPLKIGGHRLPPSQPNGKSGSGSRPILRTSRRPRKFESKIYTTVVALRALSREYIYQICKVNTLKTHYICSVYIIDPVSYTHLTLPTILRV